jgi:hypothetical protein
MLAVTAALLVAAVPASALVSGYFCQGLFLSSGGTCHSGTWHSQFLVVSGWSTHEYATCVGIDAEPGGGNFVNACSSGSAECTGFACEYSGYAYVHNHGAIGDNYTGFLNAYR